MKPLRWIAVVAGAAVVVGLFLLLRPGGDDGAAPTPSPSPTVTTGPTGDTPSPTDLPSPTGTPSPTESPSPDAVEIEIEVEEGRVEGPGEVEVAQGERVRLEVEADVVDEVHVHGYDLVAPVAPGERAVIVFRAEAPGVFEVELEEAGLLLLELSVVP